MNSQWIAVIVTSLACYALKFIGHAIPEIWLAHPRVQRITNLIPIVLLSSLVAMQAFTGLYFDILITFKHITKQGKNRAFLEVLTTGCEMKKIIVA